MEIKVAPSILSADFGNLKNEIVDITNKGADYLHIDIMDGHFVPNISFGPMVVKTIRPFTKVLFDVHLMIENPHKFIEDFVISGADIITVHVETCKQLQRTIELIKSFNVKAGVALNPETKIEDIYNVLPLCDLVLVMSVNPGFGGQAFIDNTLDKINKLSNLKKHKNYQYVIEVDGGINNVTAKLAKDKGAEVLVSGSYIFKSSDRENAIKLVRG